MISFSARILIALAALKTAQAALYVTFPVQGDTCAVSQPCQIKWKDDGKAPNMSTYGETTIDLVAGNASNLQTIQNLQGVANPSAATALTFTPNSGLSPTQQFAIRFIFKGNTANPIFSTFFTITGGSGTAKPIASSNATSNSPAPIIGSKAPNASASAIASNNVTSSSTANSAPQNANKSAASSIEASFFVTIILMSSFAVFNVL